ncbi:unnamed protein product [Cladocopium goreaui]|uniref:Potassium channel domain-containing protein n=1 Tax=Cladocopium goreaui TaxID=2562237 RepID=A0A9P1G5D8_9DINO|nr:unnamed protein product [Cladocopium goreaui]
MDSDHATDTKKILQGIGTSFPRPIMIWRVLIALAVVLWVFVGTIVYFLVENCPDPSKNICGWTFGQSFYYSVQTGLSIGFGLLSETNDISRAYSVLHILMGSSVIAGCLSWFATVTLDRHVKASDNTERELARFAHACHVDGYEGFTVVQLRDLLAKYPQYAADLVYKLEKDHQKVTEFTEKYVPAKDWERKNMAIQLLHRAQSELGFMTATDRASIDDILKLHKESGSILRIAKAKVQENWSAILTWSAWVVWIGLGAAVSAATCKWSWVEGIYFAVAACSTAGLQAVCEASDDYVVLTGIYCLFGVPIFALALGRVAGILVDKHMEKQNHLKMTERITSAEMVFAEHILGHPPDAKIDSSEFLQIQLLRTGKVDRDTLEEIRSDFESLAEGKDFITRDVAMKGHEHRVHKHKTPNVETSI